ncbi:magnesium transporter CorA family protein [Lapidilactobacillus mulanensis]|uniref:Magnesium transporter CorA family protein n=1 Tax=Lapidilactobacillus mulanensis TaxID=2485999 RepID=A0ABW4DMY5_9LACO|nr:magnesium transporter CorA family protein [Lapidilactobacillus mulanensis]
MYQHYQITETGVAEKNRADETNWLVLNEATPAELAEIITQYNLPDDIFQAGDQAEEVTRYETLSDTNLTNAQVLVLIDLSAENEERIEQRLQPITIIKSDELLIFHLCKGSNFTERLIQKYEQKLSSVARVIGFSIYAMATHFIVELEHKKEIIDQLDRSARVTTKNTELFRLADTQRDMVYLDHTLTDQRDTLKKLWQDAKFIEELASPLLLQDIRLRHRYAEKLVVIYRDLIETIGGLFNDMMDNHLNHLMKYLDSATLIVSVPALIAGIWGMNVGSLPGRSTTGAFWLVLLGALMLTISAAIYLARKDYTKM